MTDEELTILLIEDNPGDARLFEEMLRDETELVRRVDAGATTMEGVDLRHEETLADGLAALGGADVVLLDLGLPDSTGLDTLTAVTGTDEPVPVVVLTGLDDRQAGVDAIQAGAQDYLLKDEVTSDLLVRTIHHATERHQQARERERRREQLEALNRLNRIGQDITHAVITSSSREELERAVCERLVDSDGYEFAWLGDVTGATDEVTPRASAGGADGYLESITVTADGSETGEGPVGLAIRTHEVQVSRGLESDPAFEPWRAAASEHDFRAAAAVPIVHEDLLYGTLTIYAGSETAFSDAEVDVLSRLGDVIGHAIAAIERKDALVSDTVLELEFRAADAFGAVVDAAAEHEGAVDVTDVVRSDDALIAYGEVTDVPEDAFRAAVDRSDGLSDVRVLSGGDDEYEFELLVPGVRSLGQAVATHGGRLASATAADGELRFVVEFPAGADKRKLVSLVTDHCPGASTHAQRTVDRRERGPMNARAVFEERLTEKQRAALETAYRAGMFDWPRESTGEEVADRLGVTPATFSQHLRAAERKVFESIFEDDEPPEADPVTAEGSSDG